MKTRQASQVIARLRRALLGAGVGLSLIAAGPVRAAVICVPVACDVSCTATAGTIQAGIDAAIGGDTVLVCSPGVYSETVTAGHGGVVPGSAGIDIDKSLTLKSTGGAGTTTITNGGGPPAATACRPAVRGGRSRSSRSPLPGSRSKASPS